MRKTIIGREIAVVSRVKISASKNAKVEFSERRNSMKDLTMWSEEVKCQQPFNTPNAENESFLA